MDASLSNKLFEKENTFMKLDISKVFCKPIGTAILNVKLFAYLKSYCWFILRDNFSDGMYTESRICVWDFCLNAGNESVDGKPTFILSSPDYVDERVKDILSLFWKANREYIGEKSE